MEVHQLAYVVAVADHGSFTRAAAALHVSQSGVSMQVALLERELGVRIFERGTRRVTPTHSGVSVIAAVRQALAGLDQIRQTASDLTGLLRGTLRMGAVAGLIWSPLLDALASFRARHPEVGLRRPGRMHQMSSILDF